MFITIGLICGPITCGRLTIFGAFRFGADGVTNAASPSNACAVSSSNEISANPADNNRQNVFFSHADRDLYLALAHEQLADAGITVLAHCL